LKACQHRTEFWHQMLHIPEVAALEFPRRRGLPDPVIGRIDTDCDSGFPQQRDIAGPIPHRECRSATDPPLRLPASEPGPFIRAGVIISDQHLDLPSTETIGVDLHDVGGVTVKSNAMLFLPDRFPPVDAAGEHDATNSCLLEPTEEWHDSRPKGQRTQDRQEIGLRTSRPTGNSGLHHRGVREAACQVRHQDVPSRSFPVSQGFLQITPDPLRRMQGAIIVKGGEGDASHSPGSVALATSN